MIVRTDHDVCDDLCYDEVPGILRKNPGTSENQFLDQVRDGNLLTNRTDPCPIQGGLTLFQKYRTKFK
jgi:hypothetical protein